MNAQGRAAGLPSGWKQWLKPPQHAIEAWVRISQVHAVHLTLHIGHVVRKNDARAHKCLLHEIKPAKRKCPQHKCSIYMPTQHTC
eukprot:1151981-Pelagomonas_calceolata.AAC.3